MALEMDTFSVFYLPPLCSLFFICIYLQERSLSTSSYLPCFSSCTIRCPPLVNASFSLRTLTASFSTFQVPKLTYSYMCSVNKIMLFVFFLYNSYLLLPRGPWCVIWSLIMVVSRRHGASVTGILYVALVSTYHVNQIYGDFTISSTVLFLIRLFLSMCSNPTRPLFVPKNFL
jgi:hypothetical protein